MTKFPPTHAEALESRETGSSLVEAIGGGNDTVIAATLKQLGLGGNKEAPKIRGRVKHVNLERRKAMHANFQKQKKTHKNHSKMIQNRSKLPAFARQAEIVATVAANPVTIIQGETGCGKSTQCPQFLLDANPTANIVVTQRTYYCRNE
jgi:HrpA-like RNA helicase